MLQHLSVSHFYTLCTHNLTKFLLCWRVIFCLLSFGCCPPVPPSFPCTLFFFFNFPLSFHFLMFFFYYSSWYSSFPPLSPFSIVSSSLLTPFSSSFSFSCFSYWSSSLVPSSFSASHTAWLSSMIIQKMLSYLVLCVSCSQFLCLAETLSLLLFNQNNILWVTVISWTMYHQGVVIFLQAFSLVD